MHTDNQKMTQVQRTPRIIPEYAAGQLLLEDPARQSIKPTFAWMTILLPPLAMLTVLILSSILIRSHLMIFTTIGMTIVTVMISILNYNSSVKKHKDQTKKQEKKYLDYLYHIRNELQLPLINSETPLV